MYKLAICLPVLNGEKTLEKAIKSILPVLSDKICLIISDNASNDRTEIIARQYMCHSMHIFINVEPTTSQFEQNFIRCAEIAHKLGCEFVSYMGHDDCLLPSYRDFTAWLIGTVAADKVDYIFINSARYTLNEEYIGDVVTLAEGHFAWTKNYIVEKIGLNVAFTPTLCFSTKYLLGADKTYLGSGWFYLELIYKTSGHRMKVYNQVCTRFYEGSTLNMNGKFFELIQSLLAVTSRLDFVDRHVGQVLRNHILTRDILKSCYTQKIYGYQLQLKDIWRGVWFCRYSIFYGILFIVGIMIPRFVYLVFYYLKKFLKEKHRNSRI